jgi:23S rRNA (pseudouridine1915-N3)-methyltransferase
MQKITIISVGRLKEDYLKAAEEEYIKRLKGFCDLKVIEISAEMLPQHPTQGVITSVLEDEAEKIISKVPKNSDVIPLCIEGKLHSSEDMADMISENASFGSGSITFIIGGSYGLAERVKALGKKRLSMSKMTFPHQLARIMLLEQIYRAFKISQGGTYHK